LQTIRPWVPKNSLLVRDPPCLGILQHSSLEQCGVGHAFDTEETAWDFVRNKSQRVSRCSKCGSAMVVITSRGSGSRQSKVRSYNFGGEGSQWVCEHATQFEKDQAEEAGRLEGPPADSVAASQGEGSDALAESGDAAGGVGASALGRATGAVPSSSSSASRPSVAKSVGMQPAKPGILDQPRPPAGKPPASALKAGAIGAAVGSRAVPTPSASAPTRPPAAAPPSSAAMPLAVKAPAITTLRSIAKMPAARAPSGQAPVGRPAQPGLLPGARPASSPASPPARGAGASGAVSEKALENKQIVKMRKVEALVRQLLDEWTTLDEAKKPESFDLIATKFMERVEPKYLAQMAEKFGGSAPGASASNGHGGADWGKEESEAGFEEGAELAEEVVDGVEEAVPEEEAEATWAEAEVAAEAEAEAEAEEEPAHSGGGDGAVGVGYAEEMKALLKSGHKTDAALMEVWSSHGFTAEDVPLAVASLFEAAMRGEGGATGTEVAARLVVELARKQQVELKTIEHALSAASGTLEDLVQESETAWHLYSHVIMLLFPKTVPSTTWGFLQRGWNWASWWAMATKVLEGADHFRAFDILVLVLQMIQDKSGAKIRQQQVWKEAGRAGKVKAVLCRWGEMDDASTMETLQAYSVEI